MLPGDEHRSLCRQRFICMVFAQLTSRDGLRDIATSLYARLSKRCRKVFTMLLRRVKHVDLRNRQGIRLSDQ